MTFHDFDDDDRAPRHFVPSGKMDRLPDGGQFVGRRYDIAAPFNRVLALSPKGLRTRRQLRQHELDKVYLARYRDGHRVSAIASTYGVPRRRVYDAFARLRRLAEENHLDLQIPNGSAFGERDPEKASHSDAQDERREVRRRRQAEEVQGRGVAAR